MEETESDFVTETLDQLIGFFESVGRVPKWRFKLAFLFLGEEVNIKLKEINGKGLCRK